MSRPLALAAILLVAMLLACTLSMPMTGGISGSGNIVTFQEDITDFDRVVISYAFEATIQQADAYSVVLRVDDSLREYVRVSKVGKTLEIGIDPTRIGSIRRGTLEAEVTLPALASLDVSGASSAELESFACANVQATVSGASSAVVNTSGSLDAEASGASHLSYVGNPTLRNVDTSGSSTVEEK